MVTNQATFRAKRAPRLWPSALLLLLGGLLAAACGGVNDVGTGKTNKAGSGGGGSDGTGDVDTSGGTPDMGTGTGGEPTMPMPTLCREGKQQCSGNTPQTCNADGEWEDGEACTGATKVCTGDGVCAAYRLVNAGIDSFGARPAEPVAGSTLILKEQTLSANPRTCSKSGRCVTGGIR